MALADTLGKCDLPVELLGDLLTAFTMDVTKRRYANWEELMTYCRYSANPVGRLVLLLFGIRDPKLHQLSDSICTGLQLTNHWQDLSVDTARDMLYVPEALLKQHGLSASELLGGGQGCPEEKFRALMITLIGRTRALFDAGTPLLRAVSGRLRVELKLTLLGGRQILRQIEAMDYKILQRRPVLSGWTQARLLTRAMLV